MISGKKINNKDIILVRRETFAKTALTL